jgi:hypothetical protein
MMEHRSDLEDLLLNGLPEQERRRTMHSINATTARKIRRLRAQGVRDDAILDLTDTGDTDGETLV